MIGSLLGFFLRVFKWTSFSAGILIAGQLVHWQGQPISEHVKRTLSLVEGWTVPAQSLAQQAREKADPYGRPMQLVPKKSQLEKISAAERAQLRKVFNN
ncbi:MAG: hypothetical protein KGQ59_00285 [Bdellovibrionales bacterium]|nr:hypothetical protein [Bdellovibrionales bacterium]